MQGSVLYTVLGLVAGLAGTGLGGIISAILPIKSNRAMASLLEFSGGVMMAVVCFDLMPEAFKLVSLPVALLAFAAGVFSIALVEDIIERYSGSRGGLERMGFTICVAIALHNLPEGLAIGSGFVLNESLGFSLMMAIMLHNIPEGISLALPFRLSGRRIGFLFWVCMLSGFPTGVGALLGALAGGVSQTLIACCLAFAGGAMIYVVCGDIIPKSKELFRGRMSVFSSIAGFITGVIIVFQAG